MHRQRRWIRRNQTSIKTCIEWILTTGLRVHTGPYNWIRLPKFVCFVLVFLDIGIYFILIVPVMMFEAESNEGHESRDSSVLLTWLVIFQTSSAHLLFGSRHRHQTTDKFQYKKGKTKRQRMALTSTPCKWLFNTRGCNLSLTRESYFQTVLYLLEIQRKLAELVIHWAKIDIVYGVKFWSRYRNIWKQRNGK